MKKSCAILFLTGLFSIAAITVQAANCNSQNGTVGTPSNFDTNGTWSCNAVPTKNDNITVTHYITRTGNLSYDGGTQVITINSGGYLKIVGDFLLRGTNERIVINSGGTLEVTGTLTVENGNARIEVENGGTLKVGTGAINGGGSITVKTGGTATFTTLTTSSNANAVYTNNGSTTVSGNVTFNSPVTNSGSFSANNFTLTNSGAASFSTTGTLTIGNDISIGKTFSNTGTMTVGRDLEVTSSGQASLTNSGSLTIGRNASSARAFKVEPGGYTYVTGNFTTTSNESLTVGTDVAPTPYADMVINGNLISNDSGDVRVKDNGRLAIFGGFTKSTNNGGVTMVVESMGQVYLHNQMNFAGAGGGNSITNQNSPTSYGFYYDGGTPSNGTIPANTPNSTDMQTTNPTFYNWIGSQAGAPWATLPITLAYFRTGGEQSNGILLEWATAMEKNFNHFEVQVSKQGNEFEPIARIKGRGESATLSNYSFLDASPSAGRNYYRLKSIDNDGSFEYSSVIAAVWNGNLEGISVYPNPTVNRRVKVALPDDASEIKNVALFDQTGSMVWENSDPSQMLEIEFPESIKNGVYFLSFYTKSGKRNIRVVLR